METNHYYLLLIAVVNGHFFHFDFPVSPAVAAVAAAAVAAVAVAVAVGAVSAVAAAVFSILICQFRRNPASL